MLGGVYTTECHIQICAIFRNLEGTKILQQLGRYDVTNPMLVVDNFGCRRVGCSYVLFARSHFTFLTAKMLAAFY